LVKLSVRYIHDWKIRQLSQLSGRFAGSRPGEDHSSCKTDDCQFVLARSFPGLVQSVQGFQQPLFVRQAVKIPGIEVKQEDTFSLKRFQFHGWASRSINSSGSEFGRLYSDPRIVV